MRFDIKSYRKSKGLTQEELAKRAGMVRTVIAKLETGATADPNLSTMVKIADALNVTVDDLIEKN